MVDVLKEIDETTNRLQGWMEIAKKTDDKIIRDEYIRKWMNEVSRIFSKYLTSSVEN